ncbi:hypothetical protein D3C72_676960 [compost metagenome]
MQRAPVGHGLVPLHALRRVRTTLHIFERHIVHGHQAGAGASFDRHVADGHAAFHRQVADGGPGELHGVARTAGRADLADDGQHDVLGGAAARQLAFHTDQHVLGLLAQQRLRGQHVFHLRRADAMCQCAERAVRAGMRIAADHGHARQRGALLRPDHVDDALAVIGHLELGDAEGVAVGVQRIDLELRDGVGDALRTVRGRHVVVGHGQVRADAPDRTLRQLQPLERLRAGHFMHQVAIDVEQRRAVFLDVDGVVIPEFVVERLGHDAGGADRPSGQGRRRSAQWFAGIVINRMPSRVGAAIVPRLRRGR